MNKIKSVGNHTGFKEQAKCFDNLALILIFAFIIHHDL